jgi:DNA polymerase III delta prime subunit
MLEGMIENDIFRPPLVIIYGPQGVGKTTFGAEAPDAVLLPTEEGGGILTVKKFPLITDYDTLMKRIGQLLDQEHDRKTVVLDSLDHLEPLIWAETCRSNGWQSIEQEAYGKGYLAALEPWREVMSGLNALRDERGMSVVMTAHADVKRFNSPTSDPYDRYRIKLQDRASALVQEYADAVLFAKVQEATTQIEEGTGKAKKVTRRGVSGGKRILYCEERPAFLAKNRYDLPAEMPLEWSNFAKHVPHFNRDLAPADVAGV